MTTRLEEIKNYLAFHNKPSRLADQPLVQDLAWAVARIEKLTEAARYAIAHGATWMLEEALAEVEKENDLIL